MTFPFRKPGPPDGPPPELVGVWVVIPRKVWLLITWALICNGLATTSLAWTLFLRTMVHR